MAIKLSAHTIKNFLKVLAVNIGITIFLIGLLVTVPPLVNDINKLMDSPSASKKAPRADLPNYENNPWVDKHFYELKQLKTTYYDFIGWRRMPFDGETITVDKNGYRQHGTKTNSPENAEIWVFGGSTIWGTGTHDDATIPAFLEKLTGKSTFNFGESAYIAHQSLNLLMRQYAMGGKPKVVIFYDGVNDVSHKCRKELGFYSTGHEQQIREKVEKGKSEFLSLFKPLIEDIAENDKGKKLYDCDTNTDKANLIIKSIEQDWLIAKNLVEMNGGKFIAILQPVSYIGTPSTQYLPIKDRDPIVRAQFESIYPNLKKSLLANKISYYDATNLFDGDEKFYIDFCHVSPNGNEKVAAYMASKI